MKDRPIKDRIIVRPEPEEDRFIGNLSIPENKRHIKGTAISVGKFVEEIQVNDILTFNKYSGVEITIDDEDLLIIQEDDVLTYERKE